MIHLIIKGDLEAACSAASNRNIPLASARRHAAKSFHETLATVDDSYWPERHKQVGAWFAEPVGEAPFADGTLLWFGGGSQ